MKLLLHAGPMKTGSTAFQELLLLNGSLLEQGGIRFRHLRRQELDDLEAVVALGDQIYEYFSWEANDNDYGRYQWPETECVQEFQYQQRWLTTRLDPDLQAASQQLPWYVAWDDHEVANEAFANGSQYHNIATQGPYLDRKAAALRAFYLWNPILIMVFVF